MRLFHYALATILAAVLVFPAVLGGTILPVSVNPVTNGNFDHPVLPSTLQDFFRESPLDSCTGIGHQVLYGSDTIQGELTPGTGYWDLFPPDDPQEVTTWANYMANNSANGPQDAADRFTEDPQNETHDEAMLLTGYENCVFSQEEGYDLVWLAPVERMNQPLHWSKHPDNPGVTFGYLYDGDPFDREAAFLPGVGVNHNMWQAYPSPFQGFSADFDELQIEIEAGTIPDNAKIQLFLNGQPRHHVPATTADVYETGTTIDCSLTFNGTSMAATLDGDNVVHMPPTDAIFSDRNDPDCQDLKEDWDAGNESDKREVLSQLRFVQISFRGWNTGDDVVVVDNFRLDGAATLAEEAVTDPRVPQPLPGSN